MVDWKITLTSILCITALEAYALYQNIDGTTLAACIAIIAGLGGYSVAKATRSEN